MKQSEYWEQSFRFYYYHACLYRAHCFVFPIGLMLNSSNEWQALPGIPHQAHLVCLAIIIVAGCIFFTALPFHGKIHSNIVE
ncbi:hypothetical protein BDY19DRAFT_769436 [Irpex rosettiformis]|uniref:Uncharacterized protein n=1 Tax=Irpex rosettiformis TaxID=378272 RepID=A0ACB8U7L8_9APHY|nr:hypothetical protein BDY19DRAFT_769436 [Irpex rosettiformis]